jgi:L-2-hydroxycarboxylate dehydrogenase (NAD+)
MKVKLQELKDVVFKAIKTYGYSDEEAKIIQEVLLYAQLRDNNQGIVKLIGKGIPKNPEETASSVVKDTKLSQLIDGGKRFGMVVMGEAMEVAVSKAKEHGFGIVGINNTFSSTGAIGYYAREIAKRGLIGFVFAGSPPTVNPHGSYEPKFGTNPLAVGIPGKDLMYVFDMATSAMAYFGLVQAKTAGKTIPGDIAYDAEGNLTTDPGLAMDGAIRPFDRSYKGYGLSLLVELLTGPLISASFVGIEEENGWGNMMMVIDPELFGDSEKFQERVSALLKNVKESKRLDGVEEVFIPGEKGDRVQEEYEKAGEIEVENNLYKELLEKTK